jgi:hypothetical protein
MYVVPLTFYYAAYSVSEHTVLNHLWRELFMLKSHMRVVV